MRTWMARVIVEALALVTVLLAAAAPAPAISLDFVPALSAMTVGGEVEVILRISGLGDHTAPSLRTFDLEVLFDPAVVLFALDASSFVLGDQLDPTGQGRFAADFDPSVGSVGLIGSSLESVTSSELDGGQAGSFALAMLVFQGIGPGLSPLHLAIFDLLDSQEEPLAAVGVGRGTIAVTPSPSPLLLLALGLTAAVIGRHALR